MARRINTAGLKLIESFESLRLEPYNDGVGVMTIGWGHAIKPGEHFSKITVEKAAELLQADLKVAERDVQTAVTVDLNDNQFAALVSLAFNIGGERFRHSSLVRFLNQGKYLLAADQFRAWNKGGGQVMKGLVRRREAERTLFLTAVSRPLTGAAEAALTENDQGEESAESKPVENPPVVAAASAATPVPGGGPDDKPVTLVPHKPSLGSRVVAMAGVVGGVFLALFQGIVATIKSAMDAFGIGYSDVAGGIGSMARDRPTVLAVLSTGLLLFAGGAAVWHFSKQRAAERTERDRDTLADPDKINVVVQSKHEAMVQADQDDESSQGEQS